MIFLVFIVLLEDDKYEQFTKLQIDCLDKTIPRWSYFYLS